jgi:succinyl-diaminopimelate desuccinylase
MKSSALYRSEIDRWFDCHKEEMLSDLAALIAVKSVDGTPQMGMPYGSGPRRALDVMTELIQEKGFAVDNFENRVISADLNGRTPILGILAHLDVVAEGDGWDTDPFQLTIRDGCVFGRGVTDDKGPAVAALYAMWAAHVLAPELPKGCRLIFGSAEETGSDDIARYRQSIPLPEMVFTPDADYPLINLEKGRFAPYFTAVWPQNTARSRVVRLKGGCTPNVVPHYAEAVITGISLAETIRFCRTFEAETGVQFSASETDGGVFIQARGKSAHAAHPEEGNNAQTALVALLAAMPFAESPCTAALRALARLFPHGDVFGRGLGVAMSDAQSGNLTLNFGVLEVTETGLRGNFDSRTPTCATEENMADVVDRALFDAGLVIERRKPMTPCHHTPADSPFVQTLLRIYETYTGKPGRCQAIGGGTYVHDIPGGVAFGCEMPGVDHRIHGANEFIAVDDLILSAKMFTQAILDICG